VFWLELLIFVFVCVVIALKEHEEEGGVQARGKRYQENHDIIIAGLIQLKFKAYLRPEDRSCIISTFLYPNHRNWSFKTFYDKLSDKGYALLGCHTLYDPYLACVHMQVSHLSWKGYAC